MGCLKIGRHVLVVVEGSPSKTVHFRISTSPVSFQTKLILRGGDSVLVPVNLFHAGKLISSIVEVVVFCGESGVVLYTYPPLLHSLAHYKEIRLAVEYPFAVQFELAPAGFWFNFFRLFSFRRGIKKSVKPRRPNSPVDIESQAASNLCEQMNEDSSILRSPIHKDEELDKMNSVSDAHCIESDLSERMSYASSVLDYPISYLRERMSDDSSVLDYPISYLRERMSDDSSVLDYPISDLSERMRDDSSVLDYPILNLSERMSKDSSVLDSPIHNVCRQKEEEIDNKSDAPFIKVIMDDSYDSEGFSTEASPFWSCTSPSEEYNTPSEENVCELEARSSSLVGSI